MQQLDIVDHIAAVTGAPCPPDVLPASSPFAGYPRHKFQIIAADCPWTFLTRSAKGKGRSAEKHYACMTLDDIKRLPVADLAAKDCMLFFWVTDPFLEIGLSVIKAWGFEYKTVGFTWAKQNRQAARSVLGGGELESGFFTGMGYYTRANPEQCLLATRGSPKRVTRDVRQLIIAPRREHSRKPDEAYARMKKLCGDVPAIELFARQQRPGWAAWGLETQRFATEEKDYV
jgi:N6-adenosine-specific RNA methylase IME4